MTTYHAAFAQLPGHVARDVRITVTDGAITQLTPRRPAADGDIRLPGLTMPGVGNAHSHLFHRGLRGRTHAGGGNFWSWRDEMYAVAQRLTPQLYRDLARAVLLEMLLAGYTLAGEFHYLHHGPHGVPYEDPNAMGRAVVDAAAEVGIRLTLLDTCYLHGGLTPQGQLPLDPTQLRFADPDVAAWAERVAELSDGPLLRIGAAAHSVRALAPSELRELGEATAGRVVHAHVSEQPAENAACLAVHAMTPVELLDQAGLLGPGFTAVHATHLSDHDIELLGASGSAVCVCPTTERDLADGIGPFRLLHERGVPLSVGSDQNAVLDAFEEIRGVELHERLDSGERGRFTPEELHMMAGPNGYAALGWRDGGRLQVGALADFISLRLDSRRTTGANPEQVVFAAGAGDITDVVVGGRHLVRAGEHSLGPVDELLVAALEHLRRVEP